MLLAREHSARAESAWSIYATTVWDDDTNVRGAPDSESDIVASFPPGTTVLLLDGPTGDDWYYVTSADDRVSGGGWIAGWLLIFEQRARAVVDSPLLGSPGDASTEFGWIRHGFTVTHIGPVAGEWALIRSSDRVGYVSIWGLEPAQGSETDRYSEWWVDVDRSNAIVSLVVGDSVVDRFDASVSANDGEGFYATATGTYWIYQKLEGLTYTPYADAYFRHWAGFDSDRFNGFHSWTMDSEGDVLNGGWGTTAGCVATAPADAETIYWFVDIGTRVEVHW